MGQKHNENLLLLKVSAFNETFETNFIPKFTWPSELFSPRCFFIIAKKLGHKAFSKGTSIKTIHLNF